jgi:hypothetical protein
VYEVTVPRVLVVLAFYAALLMVVRVVKPRIEPFERRTFAAIGLGWAVPVFVANYLLSRPAS